VTTALDDATFELVELDLLSTYAGTRLPFPLRVPSFGRIEHERADLLAAAGASLAERGLATDRGPTGVAADLVTALREHRGTVDLVVVGRTTVTGVVALVRDRGAVVCRQEIGGTPGPVTVARVSESALPDVFLTRIPEVGAAPVMPITLPPGVVGDATRLLEKTGGVAAPEQRVRALVRERGGDEGAVDALLDLLPSVEGRGQLGVLARRSGTVERVLEVSWLDGPRGRVRVNTDDNGWLSVNPLRHGELVRTLRQAVAAAHG
jgi:hypothetical protein